MAEKGKSSGKDDKSTAGDNGTTDAPAEDVLDNQVPDPGASDEDGGDAAITNSQS